MGRTREDIRRQAQSDDRALGLRLIAVAGVLLALDLVFLPWHHFTFDLNQFGGDFGGTVSVDRTGVETPNAALGVVAAVAGLGMALYAAVDGKVRARTASGAAASQVIGDRLALLVGPAVLALLLLKLVLETEFLGIGALLGILLAAALAWGGLLISQETLLGVAGRVLGGDKARGGQPTLTQKQRWVLLGSAVVVGTLVALALQTEGDNELFSSLPGSGAIPTTAIDPGLTDPSLSPDDPSATALFPPSDAPSSSQAAAGAPATNQTTVEPQVAETGSAITVSGRGATPGVAYLVKLSRQSALCGSGTPLGGTRLSAGDGSLTGIRAIVPANLSSGTYYVCLTEESDSTRSLRPAELLVS